MSQRTMNQDKKVRELLKSEIEGKHGMSERRAVAAVVRDAMDGAESENPVEDAAKLADNLEGFAKELARLIRKIK